MSAGASEANNTAEPAQKKARTENEHDADIDERLKCPRCKDILFEPVALECQHACCAECVRALVDGHRGWGVLCPACKSHHKAKKLAASGVIIAMRRLLEQHPASAGRAQREAARVDELVAVVYGEAHRLNREHAGRGFHWAELEYLLVTDYECTKNEARSAAQRVLTDGRNTGVECASSWFQPGDLNSYQPTLGEQDYLYIDADFVQSAFTLIDQMRTVSGMPLRWFVYLYGAQMHARRRDAARDVPGPLSGEYARFIEESSRALSPPTPTELRICSVGIPTISHCMTCPGLPGPCACLDHCTKAGFALCTPTSASPRPPTESSSESSGHAAPEIAPDVQIDPERNAGHPMVVALAYLTGT